MQISSHLVFFQTDIHTASQSGPRRWNNTMKLDGYASKNLAIKHLQVDKVEGNPV